MSKNGSVKLDTDAIKNSISYALTGAVKEGVAETEKNIKSETIDLSSLGIKFDDSKFRKVEKQLDKRAEGIKKSVEKLQKATKDYKPQTATGINPGKSKGTKIDEESVRAEAKKKKMSKANTEKYITKAKYEGGRKVLEDQITSINIDTATEKELEKQYKAAVRLKAALQEIKQLSTDTKTKYNAKTDVGGVKIDTEKMVDGVIKNFESNVQKWQEQQTKNIQSEREKNNTQRIQAIAKASVQSNPLAEVSVSTQTAQQNIEESNKKIKQSTSEMIASIKADFAEYEKLEQKLSKDGLSDKKVTELEDKQFEVQDRIGKRYGTLKKYNLDTSGLSSSEENRAKEFKDDLYENTDFSSNVIEQNRKIIDSNNEVIANNREYVKSAEFLNKVDLSGIGDDLVSGLSEESEKAKQQVGELEAKLKELSSADTVDAEEYNKVTQQLEQAQKSAEDYEETIKNLNAQIEKLQGGGSSTGTGNGNGFGLDEKSAQLLLETLTKISDVLSKIDAKDGKLNLGIDEGSLNNLLDKMQEIKDVVEKLGNKKENIISDGEEQEAVTLLSTLKQISEVLSKIDSSGDGKLNLGIDEASLSNILGKITEIKETIQKIATGKSSDVIGEGEQSEATGLLNIINGIKEAVSTISNKSIDIKIDESSLNGVLEKLEKINTDLGNLNAGMGFGIKTDNTKATEQQSGDSKKQERYQYAKSLFQEYADAQDTINKGNYQIAYANKSNKGRSNLIEPDDTSRASDYTKVTQAAIERQLEDVKDEEDRKNKNPKNVENAKNKLAAYVHNYGSDSDKVKKIFGSSNSALYDDIQDRITRGVSSNKAKQDAESSLGYGTNILRSELGNPNTVYTGSDNIELTNMLKQGKVNEAMQFASQKFEVDPSKFTSEIKSQNVDLGLQDDQQEATTLLSVLQNIKTTIANIDTSSFKLDFNEESLNGVLDKLQEIVTEIKLINDQDIKVDDLDTSKINNDNLSQHNTGADNNKFQEEATEAVTLESKIDAVTASVDAKTNAFREEGQVVSGVVQSEIGDLDALDGTIVGIINDIEKMGDLYRTAFTSAETGKGLNDQVKDLADNPESLKEFKQTAESLVKQINDLKKNTSGLSKTFQNLDVGKKASTNMQKLSNAILNLKTNLNNLGDNGKEFLNSIKEISAQADGLKSLAQVLKSTQKEVKNAGNTLKNANATENDGRLQTESLRSGSDEWNKIVNAASVYKGELKEIASIQKSVRDTKDGLAVSYKVTDIEGNSRTFGENSDMIGARDTITNPKGVYDDYEKVIKQFYAAQKKIATGTATNEDVYKRNEAIAQNEKLQAKINELKKNGLAISERQNSLDAMEAALMKDVAAAEEKAKNAAESKKKTTTDVTDTTTAGSTSAEEKNLDKISQAYKTLTDTELQYQRVKAKVDTLQGSKNDERDLIALNNRRKESLTLTKQQLALDSTQQKYAQKYKEKLGIASANTSATYTTASENRVLDLGQAQNEAKAINTALRETESIMNGFSGNKEQLGSVFTKAELDVEKLNRSFIAGKTSLESYEDGIYKIQNTLASTVSVLGKTATAEQKLGEMMRLANEASNGKAEFKNTSDAKKGVVSLTATWKELGDTIKTVKYESKDAAGSIQQTATKGSKGFSAWNNLLGGIKNRFAEVVKYYATFVGVQDFIQVIRKGVEMTTELDTALTEMRKVSDESLSSLQAYQKESFSIASSVGTDAVTLQNSTADWMRLGENLDAAKESATTTTILKNVSEFESIDEATESLVAMSQAYSNMDKIDIVDKLNNIGEQSA